MTNTINQNIEVTKLPRPLESLNNKFNDSISVFCRIKQNHLLETYIYIGEDKYHINKRTYTGTEIKGSDYEKKYSEVIESFTKKEVTDILIENISAKFTSIFFVTKEESFEIATIPISDTNLNLLKYLK